MAAPSPRPPTRPDTRLLDRLVDRDSSSDPPDPVLIELDNLRSAHRALRSMTLRMQLLVQLGLFAATLFTPLLRLGELHRTDAITSARLLIGLTPAAVGEPELHPLAVPGGFALVRIGLALVLVGVLLGVLGSRPLTRVPLRTPGAVMASLTAFALVFGSALLVVGATVLPDQRIGLAFGIVFPLAAGVWLWHGARSVRTLDWDWTEHDD